MSGALLSASARSASFLMSKTKSMTSLNEAPNQPEEEEVETTTMSPPQEITTTSNTPPPTKQTPAKALQLFYAIGTFVSSRPKLTITIALAISILCAGGMAKLNTENRPEELWVPQNTLAEEEGNAFLSFFPPTSRFQSVIVSGGADSGGADDKNVLTKDNLVKIMEMHQSIQTTNSTYEGQNYTFASSSFGAQDVISPLKVWNYDLDKLQSDDDVMATLNTYGKEPKDFESVFGAPKFDDNGALIKWEESVFLASVESAQVENNGGRLNFAYLSSRSFSDEFGGEITGDLVFVQISYVIAFLFVGLRWSWAMSLAAIFLVALSTVAGFGVASLFGLLYGPVHSVLPFVLLGIGVDDCFVIANAFDREREGVSRASEDDTSLIKRGARALSRAGASITVTSLTDLVAFAISSSSALPALASFCAFASINILFLWMLAATFFVACMFIDEKRQRDNRRDCLCCFTRKVDEVEDTGSKEGFFRGKMFTLVFFSVLFGLGVYGTIKLPVEDSARNFIPVDSYIKDFSEAADTYFPSSGEALYITFTNGEEIYKSREGLATLDTRLRGLSEEPPYIAEPNDYNYQNVMAGLKDYLATDGASIGVVTGGDGWPTNYEDFVATLRSYAQFMGPGAKYAQDIALSSDGSELEALRVKAEYVRLTKTYRGEVLDDASRQIDAMDATRSMISSWTDLAPAFPYSATFIAIEGFKIINTELYRNVGLAIAAVGIIVLITVANIVTAMLITVNVAFCIIEILGAMFALGLVIDSVSVINIVLAVGLSIDYSAHIGHCFMVKGGTDNDARATESLADIGASVLNGAMSTFLAVAVLLFSKSYVFRTLAIQFALTVTLGVLHGLILLPVLLALFGPKPFASAEPIKEVSEGEDPVVKKESISPMNTAHETQHEVEQVGEDAFEENTA
ncbi:patched family protein [Skeletonema marinoi]|uniref:Patched family protein n=1 Tax=Skeletonema marinoi TaxID=267567 RepID=A0AAD9DHB1_9STRA|nr:patched family protein [Skeletonema marinoi]